MLERLFKNYAQRQTARHGGSRADHSALSCIDHRFTVHC